MKWLIGQDTRLSQDPTSADDRMALSNQGLPKGDNLEKMCRSCRKRHRGAAVVEFAIVAPVFFVMVFGMIEFGRMIMVQQVLTNASREGARIAVLDGTTVSDINTKVQSYLTAAGLPAVNPVLSPSDPSTAGYGAPVSVTVQVSFSQVSWLPTPMFLSGSTQLSATTVMRRETVQ
jgi:Flp pilus assembly protein TadG